MGAWLAGNTLLGLFAAGLWGMGDFAGGIGVKRAGGSLKAALRVVLMSHSASLCVLLALALGCGSEIPHGSLVVWGLVAGFFGGVSLVVFYVALSRGAMGASAAVSGLLAAGVPAFFAMTHDGLPGWRKSVGFAVAGVAIWLVAAGGSREKATRQTMVLAMFAGIGFGCYFVALKFAGAGGVIWPMATGRLGSLCTCGTLLGAASLWGKSETIRITRTVVGWALVTAVLDTSGNLFYIAATRAGRLDVAAVLASLYPASTIVLAGVVLKEKPTWQQGLGMGVAAVAVVLIAA